MPNASTRAQITTPELREIAVESILQSVPDVTRRQIAEMLDIRRESVHRIENRVKDKPLKDKKVFINAAHKAVMVNLKRKPSIEKHVKITKDGDVIDFTAEVRPSHTNQLQAAAMVLDRAEPIKQERSDNHVSFTKIDINICQVPGTPDIVVIPDDDYVKLP